MEPTSSLCHAPSALLLYKLRQPVLQIIKKNKHSISSSSTKSRSTQPAYSTILFRPKMEAINRLTADKPVVIFSKSTCCISHTIKTLICSFGANPTVYELDQLPNGQQLESALTTSSGRRTTFPAVFIDQQLVGGANEVMSLHVKGELVPLLKKARAIWV